MIFYNFPINAAINMADRQSARVMMIYIKTLLAKSRGGGSRSSEQPTSAVSIALGVSLLTIVPIRGII